MCRRNRERSRINNDWISYSVMRYIVHTAIDASVEESLVLLSIRRYYFETLKRGVLKLNSSWLLFSEHKQQELVN